MREQRRWILDPCRGIAVSTPAGLMGVINMTPDSFSDGGRHDSTATAVAAGVAMLNDGADWLDVGGESTRPGATPVAADIEMDRVLPVIQGLRAAGVRAPISIDTSKGVVAASALQAGADVVNDVSGGSDPVLLTACARAGCPLILMHMRGTPMTMQTHPVYQDVVAEVTEYLAIRFELAVRAGIAAEAILLDPGIGFGKTTAHNLALIEALPHMSAQTGRPLVVGVSRKSLVATLAGGGLSPAQRDPASHLLHARLSRASSMLRVHDVLGARSALRQTAADMAHGRAA